MTLSFSAQVGAWAEKSKQKMNDVFLTSVERTIEYMQEVGPSVANPDSGGTGNMPVDTGFLRASLVISYTDMPKIRPNHYPTAQGYAAPAIELNLGGGGVVDQVFAGYTAAYAGFVNHGANGGPAYNFAGKAGQQWPHIVNQTISEVKSKP